MDNKSYNIRMPKRWSRIAMIVGATALIVAPLTAVATHTFNDVPDSHTFHNDIAWLADAGVTKGCNPPANTEFCPDDNVTRGQMGAFLRRLAEGQVVDAGTVDGVEAADLRVASAAEIDSTNGGHSITEVTAMNEVTIEAPAKGSLLISGGAYVDVSGGLGFGAGIEVYVNGTEVGTMAAFSADSMTHLSYSTAVEVTPGTYTVRHDVGRPSGLGDLEDANIFYNANNLSVLFVPSGEVTVAAAGESSGSLMGEKSP